HLVHLREYASRPGQEFVLPHFLHTNPLDHLMFAKNSRHFSSFWNISSSCSWLRFSLKILLIICFIPVQIYIKKVSLKRFRCHYCDLMIFFYYLCIEIIFKDQIKLSIIEAK